MVGAAFVTMPALPQRGITSSLVEQPLWCSSRGRDVTTSQHRAVPARMLVVEVGSPEQMDTVLESAGSHLVVVDYSTTWCGPCKVIAPVFEEMSERYTDVVFVKVIGDATSETGELMKREGIRAVPAFHFWKEKKRVLDFTGAKAAAIEDGIKEFGDSSDSE
jgi:thioredoxin 1